MQSAKKLVGLNLLLLGLLILSIIFFDKPLALFVHDKLTPVQPFFYTFTSIADQLAATAIFYILVVSSGLGLLLLFKKKTKKVAFVLLTLVFALMASTFITNTMKVEFSRARPDVYISTKGTALDFYNMETKDYSFPSGHASYYLSLFLPWALLFRRLSPLLLFVPGVITIGRVVQNHHYLSDVLCSTIIVLNLCVITMGIFYLVDNKLKGKTRNSGIRKAAANTGGSCTTSYKK